MDNGQFQDFVVEHLTILSEDVKSLRRDFSSMEGEFSALKGDVSTLKGDVSTLKDDVSTLKGDVSSLKKDVSSLKNTVTRIETRMENEIINKISALFDGYDLHKEKLVDHDKNILDLSRNAASHEMRLTALENR